MPCPSRWTLPALVIGFVTLFAADAGASTMRVLGDPPGADLQVSVRESSDPSIVGALLTYTVTVRNLGPDDTSLAQLETTFEGGYDNDQVSFDSPRGNCIDIGSGPTRHDCTFSPIAAGDSVVTTFGFRPGHAGTLTIHASVASAAPDGNPSNDSVTETTTITLPPSVDLAVSMKESSDPSIGGALLTYTVTVRNVGTAATPLGVLQTAWEGGYALVSLNSPGGTGCNSSSTTADCSFGTVAPGDSLVTTLGFRPDHAGTLTIHALVTCGGPDVNPSNDSATETTTITAPPPQADLFINARSSFTIPFELGITTPFDIDVGNRGNAAAVATRVLGQFSGVPFRFETYQNGHSGDPCTASATSTLCQLGTIAPGGHAQFQIYVTLLEVGSVLGEFHVESDTPEESVYDNYDRVGITAVPTPGMRLDSLAAHVVALGLKPGPEKALLRPLADARAAMAGNLNPATCAALLDFEAALRKWAGRGLSLDAAAALHDEAESLREYLGCFNYTAKAGEVQSGTSTLGTDTSAPRSPTLQLGRNPSGSTPRLSFDLGRAGRAKLSVFDVRGRLVQVLADDTFTSGPHEVTWDHPAAPGVYFYRFEPEGSAPITMRGVILP